MAYNADTQLQKLQRRIDVDDTIGNDLLDAAYDIIMQRRFPYEDWPDELEQRYWGLQIRIAVDLFNKSGAEGEMSHSENGVSRTYGAENVSTDLLAEIIPKARFL